MTDLDAVCNDLDYLLPVVAELIHQPDITPGRAHGKPHSKPPWNPAVANAYFDALETVRRLEQDIRSEVTGRYIQPARPYEVTGETLRVIVRLAHAVSDETRDDAIRQLAHHVTVILQLPAIDREERWRKIPGSQCKYCRLSMLFAASQSGRVTCLRFGACFDSNGDHPRGLMTVGDASGKPMIAWADGTIQLPAMEGLAS